jgi:hypothetical protein
MGEARVCDVLRRSLAEGNQKVAVLRDGEAIERGAGSRCLVAQGKDSLWSCRPVVEVQTRSARESRPSIVTGTTWRGKRRGESFP